MVKMNLYPKNTFDIIMKQDKSKGCKLQKQRVQSMMLYCYKK